MPAGNLECADLSATFARFDDWAGRAQKRTRLLVRIELGGLLLAAVCGAIEVRTGRSHLNWPALAAAVLFVSSLVLGVLRGKAGTERTWYVRRGAAEAAKSLDWRFAVGGDPFPVSEDATKEPAAVASYERQMAKTIEFARRHVGTPHDRRSGLEPTDWMREMRRARPDTRREVYLANRLSEQRDEYYQPRSDQHRRSARRWLAFAIASAAAGTVLSALKFSDVVDIELLGVFVALTTGAIAWSQLYQFSKEAEVYSLTIDRLDVLIARAEHLGPGEAEWARYVGDCEETLAGEHSGWLTRRGEAFAPPPRENSHSEESKAPAA